MGHIDIVGEVMLVHPATGELREAKVVTGVDDHSRFCVIAKVPARRHHQVELDGSTRPQARWWQFWLGPARAGMVLRFWTSTDVIHLSIAGVRVNTVRSHLTVADLARLAATGATNAGPPPLPPVEDGAAVEVDRLVSRAGAVALGGKILLAGEIFAGRKVGIRNEGSTLLFLRPRDPRAVPHPSESAYRRTGDAAARAAAGRSTAASGPGAGAGVAVGRWHRVVSVCGQRIGLGRDYAHRTLAIAVSETTLSVELDDGDVRIVRRTTRRYGVTAHRPERSLHTV